MLFIDIVLVFSEWMGWPESGSGSLDWGGRELAAVGALGMRRLYRQEKIFGSARLDWTCSGFVRRLMVISGGPKNKAAGPARATRKKNSAWIPIGLDYFK
jgi:hypothetical protein